MKIVAMGNKKKVYKSIRLAAEANNIPYMTLYMRLRMGMSVTQAAKKPVRKYVKTFDLLESYERA